jgi:alpha,alpha-trehalose-phosphate synthase [UDP-forming]
VATTQAFRAPTAWTKDALVDLIRAKMQDYRFIVVSNREPYVHQYSGDEIECVKPASGLATALEPIMRACGGTWIAHGSGDADRSVVDARDHVMLPPAEPSFTLRRVWLTKEQETRYYYGLSNQGLWPLCHVVYTRPAFPPEDWRSYREVNELFARTVLEEAGDAPTFVFIQDYHFALLPRLLKESNPKLIVAQFWHIPWPNAEIFRDFPWGAELLDGLLGNDLLGFHLRLHCLNFLDTVDRTVEAMADRERFEVTRGGRTTSVRPFPISIDFDDQNTTAASPETDQEMKRWRRQLGLRQELIGIGIDRLDYTKGILERLRAVDRFLTKNPDYRSRLVFIQVGVPSRMRIRQYKLLEEEVADLVEEINWKWGVGSWRPVIFIGRNVGRFGMAALHRLASFCMVSALHDGMNLVAKEFVGSRFDEDGVLILSSFAGASRELTDAILVNPFDEEGMAESIRQALEMPEEARKKRMQKMRAAVAENNIYRWAGKILSSLLKFEFATNGQADAAA